MPKIDNEQFILMPFEQEDKFDCYNDELLNFDGQKKEFPSFDKLPIIDKSFEDFNFLETEKEKNINNFEQQLQQPNEIKQEEPQFDQQIPQDQSFQFYNQDGQLLDNNCNFLPQVDTKVEIEFEQQNNDQQTYQQQQFDDYDLQSKNIFAPQNIKQCKQKEKKSQYNKNCGRYMVQQMITTMLDGTYKAKLLEYFDDSELELRDFQAFLGTFRYKEKNFLSGPRIIQQFLLSKKNEKETMFTEVFRQFSIWFFQYKALVHIAQGNMLNKDEYIKYKNCVLLRLMKNPRAWKNNKISNNKRKNVN